jgi:2-amino-4-hydroxy-6-hydroxymethyldihydropteridine diphosphokinase
VADPSALPPSALARPVWTPAYIGIGSNLDRPRLQVLRAFEQLGELPGTRLVGRSRLYDTAPVGFSEQPPFVNAVAALVTRMPVLDLFASLRALERQLGKVAPEVRFGPRLIDLDLLLYGTAELDTADLVVPHPRLHERAFVLYPLADIAPDLWLAGRGRVAALAAAADGNGVSPVARETE